MAQYLQQELSALKNRVVSLGATVEEQVRKAIVSIENRDAELGATVIKTDVEIDDAEVEVEEECLKILALHQPVAADLRLIVAILKINNDLERIGDEAVNIAERVCNIAKRPYLPVPFFDEYEHMAGKAELMLRSSLDALVNFDGNLARTVSTIDDEVDTAYGRIYDEVKVMIRKEPESIAYLLNFFLIARHLERIGDHATNIAEEVLYILEGEILRHQGIG